jgi:hypothetical protein
MQQLFPEGSFFLRALTASAATAGPDPDLDEARALRDGLDAPQSVAVFGSGWCPSTAGVLLDQSDWLATVRDWRNQVADPAGPGGPSLGLLPHRVDETGAALEGPRGSSQSIIQAFWPTVASALVE